MIEFRMPALGADMEAGTLVEWLVHPGDRITSGAIIAVVETQKGAIEVEAFHNGTIAEIVVPVGEKVPVGAVLARIDDGVAAASPPAPIAVAETPVAMAEPPAVAAAPVAATAPAPAPRVAGARIKATPVARRRATQLGLDLSHLVGTGVDGAVSLADVEAAHPKAAPPAHKGFDAGAMRTAIAAAMARSKREIPHYYLSETIDMSAALAWLERFNAAQPPAQRLLPAALLLKATALALREAPNLNGTYEDDVFTPGPGVHIGWAVALRGGGLIAPAIRDVDRKSLPEAMDAMRDIVKRARAGGLRSSEFMSATISITSLGERGAESVMGVIYPPQVAIVGFGRIAPRPAVVEGRVEARSLVTATLAADHRVSDGHTGALFLAALRDILSQPEAL